MHSIQQKLALRKAFLLCLIVCIVEMLLPNVASAASATDNITTTLCVAIKALTGPVGKAIAALIVISLAIALFLGKVTWGVAIAVAVGMGLLFGATGIVDLLSGSSSSAEAICA